MSVVSSEVLSLVNLSPEDEDESLLLPLSRDEDLPLLFVESLGVLWIKDLPSSFDKRCGLPGSSL